MKTFPVLYKTNKGGTTRFWKIYLETKSKHTEIITEYGVVDGKIVKDTTIISEGKNIGRANETTHLMQAENQALSKWEKKKNLLYHEKTETPKGCTLRPMLAEKYSEYSKYITFPCFVQPKFDGIRGIHNNGAMYSRTGKLFPHLNIITDELKVVKDLILDGEIYSYEVSFQHVSGLVRKQKIKQEDLPKLKHLVFVVYDIILPDLSYAERNKLLKELFKEFNFKHVLLAKTEIANSEEEFRIFHDAYVVEGYEGLIIRNFEGEYELDTRSKNLQKYKDFDDNEYEIVGFTDGNGREKGAVVWKCATKKHGTFDVRPKGTHKERKELFKHGDEYIGKMLTVRHFGMTDDKLPRMPVGIVIRDYE